MKEREEKKRIFSAYNCSILSAFQFSSQVPSLGSDLLGAMTQSSNIEALSFKSFKSFPKFHSYWWFLSSCHETEYALEMRKGLTGHSHRVVSQPSGKLSESRAIHREMETWKFSAAAALLGGFYCYRGSQFNTFTNLKQWKAANKKTSPVLKTMVSLRKICNNRIQVCSQFHSFL